MSNQLQSTGSLAERAVSNGHALNGNATLGRPRPRLQQAAVSSTSISVDQLRSADSPRFGGLDLEHARCLADAEAELPPILVRRATMRVIDGMHRLNAAVLRGQEMIPAQFFDGDENEAFLLAVESNIAHGLPLKMDERRAAAARIIRSHPEMSDRSIAIVAGLAAKTVAAIRAAADDGTQVSARVGRDGRVRPLNSADGRRIAGMMFLNQPDASLRKIAREAGISVGTARDVRERLRRGEDPTLPRHGERGSAPTNGSTRVGNGRRPVELVDHHSILQQLYRDPSLRYSESGRSLLRWLDGRAISSMEWERVVTTIPPHCAIVVARIARASALAWADFADALDQYVRDCDG